MPGSLLCAGRPEMNKAGCWRQWWSLHQERETDLIKQKCKHSGTSCDKTVKGKLGNNWSML